MPGFKVTEGGFALQAHLVLGDLNAAAAHWNKLLLCTDCMNETIHLT